MAVTLQQVDQALADKFSGYDLTLIDGSVVEVPVFQEHPATQIVEERAFPSISIVFQDMVDEIFQSDSEDEETISVDNVADPPEATVRKTPEWYRIRYHVHAYTLNAGEDRDLMRWVTSRMRPRDSLTIGADPYWTFREGFATLDKNEADRRVYHKVWTWDVLVDIDDPTSDRVVKQVTSIHLSSGAVERRLKANEDLPPVLAAQQGINPGGAGMRPVDANGDAVPAENAVVTRGRTVAYNTTDYWFPES